MKHILVASANRETRQVISACFQPDYQVTETASHSACLDKFTRRRYDYLFLDVDLLQPLREDHDYKSILQAFWRVFPSSEIIILCSQQLIRQAVKAVKAGASDYLTFPVDPQELKLIVDNIDENVRLQSELAYLRDRFWRGESLAVLKTNTAAMKDVFSKVRLAAPTESTVLLVGETGTGKSVIANLVHQHSSRRENQFISVHCGAIPDNLLESELFGHEKGAFTGAVRRKLGRFEIAHGGTIFLDEIGTISAATQIKLLQILQDRTFQRLGGEVVLQADVRIIAATNADLSKMCEEGAFRQDLFYRLNVFPIEMPPLRERREDIPVLVEGFLNKLSKLGSKEIRDIDRGVLEALQRYSWPGNIRELENLIERAYILEGSSVLTSESFPIELFDQHEDRQSGMIDTSLTLERVRELEIARVERKYLSDLLTKHQGKINAAAEAAGIGVRQLHKLMTKYRLRKEDFKHINP